MTDTSRLNVAALVLALPMCIAWTIGDWSNLIALNLPDTDDAMRLQQVRDWIAGQRFGDVSQHRLGGGLKMHWSRISDVVLAAIMLGLRPLAGQHAAEVAAVILWPAIQFAALLLLVASIARRIAPQAVGTALVLAALAYPASALFLPGRIDHHALQLLLVLVQLRALLARPGTTPGVVAGVAVAIGAAIGLETAPFAVVTCVILLFDWLRGHEGAGVRLSGFGLAIAAGLVVLMPLTGRGGLCDTVQPLIPVAIAGGLALSALGRLARHRWPWLAATIVALAIIGWPAVQPCLKGPYSGVDPLVQRLWLAQVAEAQPLLAAPLSSAIAYGGLLLVGLVASAYLTATRQGTWWRVIAYQAMAVLITLAQVRGAYVGAALAALPIAVLIGDARARSSLSMVLALWVAGTGLSWSLLAGAIQPDQANAAGPSCTRAGVIARLNALPPGLVMAGIDLGSYILAGTRHSVVAAPYHRNDAGNRDLYRFFLGAPDVAHAIAATWQVDYVVVCPGDLGALTPSSRSIAGGARPEWLRPVTAPGAIPAIFTPYRRLSPAPPAR